MQIYATNIHYDTAKQLQAVWGHKLT